MTFSTIEDFALERYFARWEFNVAHQLSASDVEPLTLRELVAMADDDARRRWDALTLGYTESAGLPALREEIAGMYPGLDAAHVLVMSGAEEGIFLAMHALLAAGDDVVVVTPAYQSLASVARSIGARVVEVPLRMEDRWELDVARVAKVVTARTRAIVINYPHNPTGAHLAEHELRALLELADRNGATLFSDEVYRGLEHSAAPLPPAATLHAGAVSLGVMSKSFALAGLRIGWIASRDTALRDRVARLRDYTTICNSAPSELLALMALRARDRVLERSRAIVRENLAHAAEFFAAVGPQAHWVPPRAGSTAFPRLAHGDSEALSQRLATSGRVLLLPGPVFGAAPSHFRLGLGRRDFASALRTLRHALT